MPESQVVMIGDRNVVLQVMTTEHASVVKRLHEAVYVSRLDADAFVANFDDLHGVVAMHDGRLLGYRFQRRVSSEILGDGELIVDPDARNGGLGGAIVAFFEATLPRRWKVSIVINSDLYESLGPKRSTSGFWQRQGYTLVADTGQSRVLVKQFA